MFGSDVDAFFSHRLDGYGVDLVGRFGAGGAYLDPAASEMVELASGHLRAAGVMDADKSTDGLSDIATPWLAGMLRLRQW